MAMIREYLIKSSNSTVCGCPGQNFDWSKFDWEGKTESRRSLTKHQGITEGRRSPKPWVDGNATEFYEYLHVPCDWAEHMTIYRVRPHFEVGTKYRGKMVTCVKAVEHDGTWFWQVEFTQHQADHVK